MFFPQEIVDHRFEIIDKINQGNVGWIYSAIDTHTNSLVALKTPKPGISTDFRREYNMLNRLAPFAYTPTPLAFGLTPHEPYYAMSMEGQSLEHLTSTFLNGFDERTVSLLLFHLLKAVQYIHTMNVCHCDITLQNIVMPVSPMKERVLLLDFDAAIPYNSIAGRRDINNVFMCLELASRHHLLLGQIRSLHNQNSTFTIEDYLEMIRDTQNFNEEDNFQWESENSRVN